MHLTADKNIPLVTELFHQHHTIDLLPPTNINTHTLKNTDILLIRSNINVNKNLLHNTPVKFIGTPISGIDHLDLPWIKEKKIAWANASGCNAISVAEYVVCCIARLKKRGFFSGNRSRAGIIGVGHVGKYVNHYLSLLGFDTVLNDPPRAERDDNFFSTPLNNFHDLDLICIHAPLNSHPNHPTYHLINKEFLQRQKKGCVLLNAGRGAVINSIDLLKYGKHLTWCLDVWENEPEIDRELLKKTELCTPHIAGYAIQSKWRGTEMIYHAMQKTLFNKKETKLPIAYPLSPPTINLGNSTLTWEDVVLRLYDPQVDCDQMRTLLLSTHNISEHFIKLRQYYTVRHEFSYPTFVGTKINEDDQKLLQQFGCQFS